MLARRLLVVLVVACCAAPALQSTASAAGGRRTADAAVVRRAVPAGPAVADRVSPAGRELLERGYLVPDGAAYDRAKAALARTVARRAPRAAASAAVADPTILRRWDGVFDPRTTPSDSTGAIGPTRYVELVNTKFGIYRRNGAATARGELGTLTGLGARFPFLTDPQVIWDQGTRRFYYLVLDFDVAVRTNSNGFDYAFGFSKTATPNTAADWCKYTLSFGYDDPGDHVHRLPDQPHLGDTQDFLLMGGNVFDVAEFPFFVGADIDWLTKPDPGTTCPKSSSFETGVQRKLRLPNGQLAFTPVVANQVDDAHVGWAVAARFLRNQQTVGRTLGLFRIDRTRGGDAVIQGRADAVSVNGYRLPPPAPQKDGKGRLLDTLDARLTQAVAAIDPGRGRMAVWTQHTVRGGAGSRIQWYEIDPGHRDVFQQGEAADDDLFVFNGAISPDRKVGAQSSAFGNAMVLGFDTSSSSTDVRVQMVSKVGRAAQSDFVVVRRSPGPEIDGSCQPVCRWGDYAGATPDPAASSQGSHGRVWLTNMWNVDNVPNRVDWRTVNWAAAP